MKHKINLVTVILLIILWFAILAAIALSGEAAGHADAPVVPGIEHVAGLDGELLHGLPDCTCSSSFGLNSSSFCTTSSDYELLVRVVMAESEGEPLEGKIAVANVVINRVRNRGQTVSEVIFAPAQFCTNSRFDLEPTEDCYKAVNMALRGYEVVDRDVEYFCEKSITFDYLTYVKSIGNHDFYKEKY